MKHPVIHFVLPADDPARLKKFYTELFEWEIQETGMADYMSVMTAPESGPGINGGIGKREGPEEATTNFVAVESLDEYAEKVKQLGGQVVTGKIPVPGMGWMAVCLDTEGNLFGLWEEDANAA